MSELLLFDMIFLVVVGAAEVILSIFFFTRYRTQSLIYNPGWFTLSIALWVLSNGLFFIFPNGSLSQELVGRITYIPAAFIFPLMFFYSVNYPVPRYAARPLLFALLGPTIVMSILAFSNSFITGFSTGRLSTTQYGPDFWVYVLFIIIWFLILLAELTMKFRSLVEIQRKVIGVLLLGLIVSGIIGILFNMFLPYVSGLTTMQWVGPGASIIWLGLVGWVLI